MTWVLAMSSTKDATEILQVLLRPGDRVYAVEFGHVDGMPWVEPLSAGSIVDACNNMSTDITSKAFGEDITRALQAASDDSKSELLVVAGSLYLVGDVLRLLRDAQKPK